MKFHLKDFTKYKKVVQSYEMQLTNNDYDIDLDVLNDYDCHIVGPLRDLFENFKSSTNIFCSDGIENNMCTGSERKPRA